MLKFGKCRQQALFRIVFAACANLATQSAGATEKEILFSSANPKNYEVILARAPMTDVELKGRLYLPSGSAPHPAVIITPGSGGVSPPMVRHAQALADAGIAAFLIDPFTSCGAAFNSKSLRRLRQRSGSSWLRLTTGFHRFNVKHTPARWRARIPTYRFVSSRVHFTDSATASRYVKFPMQ